MDSIKNINSQIKKLEIIIKETSYHLTLRAGNPYILHRKPYDSLEYRNWRESALNYIKTNNLIGVETISLLAKYLTLPNEDSFESSLGLLNAIKEGLLERKDNIEEALLKNQKSDIHLGKKQAADLDTVLKYFVDYSKGIQQYYLVLENIALDTKIPLHKVKEYAIRLYEDGYIDFNNENCAALKQKGLDFAEDIETNGLWGYSKKIYFENQDKQSNFNSSSEKANKTVASFQNQITPILKAKIIDTFLQKIKGISIPKKIAEIIENSPIASAQNEDLFRIVEFEMEALNLVKFVRGRDNSTLNGQCEYILSPIGLEHVLNKKSTLDLLKNNSNTSTSILKRKSIPTTDFPEAVYKDVLTTLRNGYIAIEKRSAFYKGEDDLRDFGLALLESRYERASAAGEAFNKDGKTDIILKADDGRNLFVAECKIWHGTKKFNETVEQLFGYLTWRDTKAALIFYVREKDFSDILDKIELAADSSSYLLQKITNNEESSFSYIYEHRDHPKREVSIEVMAFSLPK